MVEIRRGDEGGSTGDRLPWLEPVEDEDGVAYDQAEETGGYGGVVLAGIGVLLAIALITSVVVWFRHHRAATADIGEVIHAEPGPYKVRPADPGGFKTDAIGAVAAGTSAGEDIDSVLDLNAVPEAPVMTRKAAAHAPQAPQAAPAPAVDTPRPAPAATPPADTAPATSGAIQLGAFSTEGKAKAAWKALSARFAFLKEMTPVVSAVDGGDAKLFRLRATGATQPPARLCAQLRVAGESCAVVGG